MHSTTHACQRENTSFISVAALIAAALTLLHSRAPEPPPEGFEEFTRNLQLTGQSADAESGPGYNGFRSYDSSRGRYVQSDPVGLAAGINTYAYVNGQPTQFIDPMGLWSTRAHNYFLRQMFPGIDPVMLSALEAGSAAADGMKYQDAGHVYMHAMSSDNVSPAESRTRMCQFIKDKRALYQTYAQHGLPYSAFFEMGMALHPVMDSTSPAHRGFQPWRYRDAGNHGGNQPGLPSMEDVDTAPKYLDETLQLMQKVFNGQLDCVCSDLP